MNVPLSTPAYQLISILNVLLAPVLTWIEATYCWPAVAANRGLVTMSRALDPPKPVVRSMPVTPVWRAYPDGELVQSVALPVTLFLRLGFGLKFVLRATIHRP